MAADQTVVRGTVRDAAGKPVAGARVFFASGPVPVPDVAAVTDAEGRFALSAPAAGTYRIECHAEGPGAATAMVTVPGAGETEIELRPS
jgi:hypothetical protein